MLRRVESEAPQARFCFSSASATRACCVRSRGTDLANAATCATSGGVGKNLRISGEYERKSLKMRVVCGMELNEMQSGITRTAPDNKGSTTRRGAWGCNPEAADSRLQTMDEPVWPFAPLVSD